MAADAEEEPLRPSRRRSGRIHPRHREIFPAHNFRERGGGQFQRAVPDAVPFGRRQRQADRFPRRQFPRSLNPDRFLSRLAQFQLPLRLHRGSQRVAKQQRHRMLPVRRFDIDRIGAVIGEFDPADFRLVAFQLRPFEPEHRLAAGPDRHTGQPQRRFHGGGSAVKRKRDRVFPRFPRPPRETELPASPAAGQKTDLGGSAEQLRLHREPPRAGNFRQRTAREKRRRLAVKLQRHAIPAESGPAGSFVKSRLPRFRRQRQLQPDIDKSRRGIAGRRRKRQ